MGRVRVFLVAPPLISPPSPSWVLRAPPLGVPMGAGSQCGALLGPRLAGPVQHTPTPAFRPARGTVGSGLWVLSGSSQLGLQGPLSPPHPVPAPGQAPKMAQHMLVA